MRNKTVTARAAAAGTNLFGPATILRNPAQRAKTMAAKAQRCNQRSSG